MQDTPGLTCDRVYCCRLLLEEFGPKILHIKGIHNTVAQQISCHDFNPTDDNKENLMTFTKVGAFTPCTLKKVHPHTDTKNSLTLCLQTTTKRLLSIPSKSGRLQKLKSRIKCLKNVLLWRNINPSLLKTFKFSVRMTNLSSQKNCKGKQQNGITTTFNIWEQNFQKRLFVLQCFGKYCDILSKSRSKSAINAKSTKDASESMVNYLQSQLF